MGSNCTHTWGLPKIAFASLELNDAPGDEAWVASEYALVGQFDARGTMHFHCVLCHEQIAWEWPVVQFVLKRELTSLEGAAYNDIRKCPEKFGIVESNLARMEHNYTEQFTVTAIAGIEKAAFRREIIELQKINRDLGDAFEKANTLVADVTAELLRLKSRPWYVKLLDAFGINFRKKV